MEKNTEKDLFEELGKLKNIGEDYDASKGFHALTKGRADSILKDLQQIKLGSLQDVMTEIDQLIEERKALSKKVINEIDKISSKVENLLIEAQAGDTSPETTRAKMSLKEKQILIEEAKVKEQVECWRDIALLKRELRERIKEIKEQESKFSFLDGILEQ